MGYDGGKAGAGVYQTIINQIPPHRVYIEAFLGAGAILRNKRPAERSIGIELDPAVVAEHWSGRALGDTIIIIGDALTFLAGYTWRGGEFVYLDPPYLGETRSGRAPIYRHEMMSAEEHRRLLDLILQIPAMVAISGYYSDLYAEALAGWRRVSFQTVKRSGELATELLWMNYPRPLELHDYSYLGRNFRERERIKRKKTRWKNRLIRMPDLERFALLEAIGEARSGWASSPEMAIAPEASPD